MKNTSHYIGLIGLCFSFTIALTAITEAEVKHSLEEQFKETMAAVNGFPRSKRLSVAYGVAFSWNIFAQKYNSAGGFLKHPDEVKMKTLQGYNNMMQLVANKDPDVALGVSLIGMYVYALLRKNSKLVNHMANTLDPLAEEGWVLLGVGRKNKTNLYNAPSAN